MFKIPPEILARVPAAAIEFAHVLETDGRWCIGFDRLPDGRVWLISCRGVVGIPAFPLDDSSTWRDYDRMFHDVFLHGDSWTAAQWMIRNLQWIDEPAFE